MRASLLPNDTWWEQVRPASRASHRAQCWADTATSSGEPGGWGERSQREAGRCTIISDLVTCSGQDTQPCGTLCASQTNRLSPCSAALFLSNRQAPHTLTLSLCLSHTHTCILTHKHTLTNTLSHTYTLTHTFTHPHTHLHSPSHTYTH